jgi:hypothetical protein
LVAIIDPNVAVKVVEAVKLPGAVITAGNESVTAPAVFVEVIWLAVPETETTPPDPLVACQFAKPCETPISSYPPLFLYTHGCPIGYPVSVAAGARLAMIGRGLIFCVGCGNP